MLNAQGLSPAASSESRWKIPYIRDHILNESNSCIPILAITETWLKSYISDAQIKIPNYNSYRSDRSDSRKSGGVLLYVHDSIIVTDEIKFDDKICEGIICTIESQSMIIANIYRPPDATLASFNSILCFLKDYINSKTQLKHYDIIIMGDFNFPNINWETFNIDSTNYSRDHISQCNNLMSFMSNIFLTQLVLEPTRINNILDLVLTNNNRIFNQVYNTDTKLSDHKLIKCELLFNPMSKNITSHAPNFEPHTFRSVNLRKADFTRINEQLNDVNWDELMNLCNENEDTDGTIFTELFEAVVLQICLINSPLKAQSSKSHRTKFSRERYILNRKKRRLNCRLKCLKKHNPQSPEIQKVEKMLNYMYIQIRDSIESQLKYKEMQAVEKIKSDPKFFFSYAKKFSKLKSNTGPLLGKDGKLHNEPQKMADILQQQYTSVFSDPCSPNKNCPQIYTKETNSTLSDIYFTEEDIIKAIDEIDINASTCDNDIPAQVLKNCKNALCYPIQQIWSKSFNSGIIPPALKTQYITPVHKKGPKTIPSNYRPISLTSHLIKIFERIVRCRMVDYLEYNNLITNKQHGFRKGRSCLTQLLKHFDNLISNLQNGDDSDVIYLDYSKAFDKVDHEILLCKLQSIGIEGNLFQWIKDFLSNNRFQKVTVDGFHSKMEKVISGVPQGSVLGPILFLIYVNDLEKCVHDSDSLIGSFADDTRITHRIANPSDSKSLQIDLNNIIQWSKENNMELHDDKFELLSYNVFNVEKHSSRSETAKLFQELPFYSECYEYFTPKNVLIQQKENVRDLGVQLSSNFSWTPHINKIVDDARRVAAWVLSVFSDRSTSTMVTLYKSMIRSKLEYCCPLWNPATIQNIQMLESVQRTFTSKFHDCINMTYWERLKHLDLFSLQRRRERYIIIHMWKILNGHSPNDMNIQFYHNDRLGIRAKLPPISKNCNPSSKTIFDNSFALQGPTLWNLIPIVATYKANLSEFKTSLQSFLKKIPDLPPTTGYTSPHTNSIKEWIQNHPGGLQRAR